MPIGDLTMIFETIGEDATARGSNRVASGVDKVRNNFSKALEQIGKVQSRITFLSSVVAGFGLGGLTSQSFKQEDLKRSALGDSVTSFAEMALTGGGAFVGSIVGSVIPVIGPIVGAIAGGIVGGMVTGLIEPVIQDIAQGFRSISDRLGDYLKRATTQESALNLALEGMQEQFDRLNRGNDSFVYSSLIGQRKFQERVWDISAQAVEDTQKVIDEFSEKIQVSISPELLRLGRGQQEGGLVVRDTMRSPTINDRNMNNILRSTNEQLGETPATFRSVIEDAYQRTRSEFNSLVEESQKTWQRALRN